MLIILLLAIGTAIIGLFIFSRPLSKTDIHTLAVKRRGSAISNYYNFTTEEYLVSPKTKKQMRPEGFLHELSPPVPLSSFPSIAAALLKYKKHEWIILGFERDGFVEKLWANKGLGSASVYLELSLSSLIDIAMRGNYTTVLFLHNHPNPDPSQFSTRCPSENDLSFAQSLANLLVPEGINLLAFVCERGRHHEFWRSISEEFMPLKSFIEDVQQEVSEANWWKNFEMRMELFH